MTKMTGWLLAVVLGSFSVLVHAGKIDIGSFTTVYGQTGCVSKPTEGCGRHGDICFNDPNYAYAISGTAPVCVACMPKGFRNIATFANPYDLPCALWRAYDCDDYFVSNVIARGGANSCFLSGRKSYNIKDIFSSAQDAEDKFISDCRKFRTFGYYGLPESTRLHTEEKFCFPHVNLIGDITTPAVGTRNATVLTNYKEYYEQKFNVIVKSEHEDSRE